MNKIHRPKICYLLPEMKLGGAEKHVIQLACGLKERGYDVKIITVFREGVLSAEVKNRGIPFECLHAPYRWNVNALARIFKWLRAEHPDILHTYLFGFHFFAGLPAKLLKVPVILSSRREIAQWQKQKHLWTEKIGNYFVDGIVCCSQAAQKWTLKYEQVSREKTLTIYNGVDLNRFDFAKGFNARDEFGIPGNAFVVGTVANFAEEKGYPYLLEAAGKIMREIPEARFLFVGSGPLEEDIKKKAKEIDLGERIIFTGSRADIPQLLGAMDIFCLASVTEGFPNVILEAMAMAKPVVATNAGGIPELLESGIDGLLVPPKDSSRLADAIIRLSKEPSMAKELGCQARQKIRRDFSFGRMIDQYETFYLKSLKQKGIVSMSPDFCHADCQDISSLETTAAVSGPYDHKVS